MNTRCVVLGIARPIRHRCVGLAADSVVDVQRRVVLGVDDADQAARRVVDPLLDRFGRSRRCGHLRRNGRYRAGVSDGVLGCVLYLSRLTPQRVVAQLRDVTLWIDGKAHATRAASYRLRVVRSLVALTMTYEPLPGAVLTICGATFVLNVPASAFDVFDLLDDVAFAIVRVLRDVAFRVDREDRAIGRVVHGSFGLILRGDG